MTNEQLVKLLVASGVVKVTPGGRVKVDAGKLAGHWVDRGRGWQREPADGDGGGRHEGQDSGD